VPGPDLALSRPECLIEQIRRAQSNVEKRALSGRVIVGYSRLIQMAQVVEFMTVDAFQTPPFGSGPWVRMLRVNRARGVQITIRFLRCANLRDQAVDVSLKGGIGVNAERI